MRAAHRQFRNMLLLGAASFTITLGYLSRSGASSPADPGAFAPALPQARPVLSPAAPASPVAEASKAGDPPSTAAAPDPESLLAAAVGDDPEQRSAAIAALADAPRARALPVLLRIVELGDEPADRHAALMALRTQAIAQGDADGAIHDALRELIADGNDEIVSAHATLLLEQLDNATPT